MRQLPPARAPTKSSSSKLRVRVRVMCSKLRVRVRVRRSKLRVRVRFGAALSSQEARPSHNHR